MQDFYATHKDNQTFLHARLHRAYASSTATSAMTLATAWIPCLPGIGPPNANRFVSEPSPDTQACRKLTDVLSRVVLRAVDALIPKS